MQAMIERLRTTTAIVSDQDEVVQDGRDGLLAGTE